MKKTILIIIGAVAIAFAIFTIAKADLTLWYLDGTTLKPVDSSWTVDVGIANVIATTSPFSAGYLSYATSGKAITNSAIYQAGGNFIGIGTTTPRGLVDVWNGDFYVGSSTMPSFYIASTTGRIGIASSSPGNLFAVGNALSINSSGNLVSQGSITGSNINTASTTNWDFAYGRVNASGTSWSSAYNLTNASSSNWDRGFTAYGWGNHASQGYLTSIPNTYLSTSTANGIYLATGTAVTTYVARNDWTTIDNYPSGCSAKNVVTAIGDTLTCDNTFISTSTANNIYLSTTTILTLPFGGTGTTTAPDNGYLWIGNAGGVLTQIASATLGVSSGVSSLNQITGAVIIAGTANQITVASSSQTITLSLPSDVVVTNASTTNLSITGLKGSGYLINGGEVSTSTLVKSVNIAFTNATTTGKRIDAYWAPMRAITITEMSAISDGTMGLDCGIALENTLSTSTQIANLSADTNSASTTSFTDSTVGERERIKCQISSITSGTSTWATFKFTND